MSWKVRTDPGKKYDEFVRHGYVPHQDAGEGYHETFMFSVSHTLEYSYSAWLLHSGSNS